MLGGFGGLRGKSVDQVWMQLTFGYDTRAAAGNAPQVSNTAFVNGQEGIEDGGYKDRAACMWFGNRLVVFRVGMVRFPAPGLFIVGANGTT